MELTEKSAPPLESFEERKFAHEVASRQAELAVREREVRVKEAELARSRWLNPTVLGLFAAAVGLIGNVVVAGYNNFTAQRLERIRAQSNLMVQAIATGNSEAACKNLLFFIEIGLLDDPDWTVRRCVTSPGNGPVLPVEPRTYAPLEELALRSNSDMEILVTRAEFAETYKYEVSFAVPGSAIEGAGAATQVSVYAAKFDKDNKQFAPLSFPLIQGAWRKGQRVTFAVKLPKSYVDDSINITSLRYCVGSDAMCVPSPNLLLMKQFSQAASQNPASTSRKP